ncbi:hypothetical protein [Polluticoccus soli]|uniref:hypothetical protein n=1 Tax=Polluticoccus soli TaxID=3034150 RepID=UPI0023E10D3C|nr:hypothetical protein [Flavipsychrobacter sp. JY13-12]
MTRFVIALIFAILYLILGNVFAVRGMQNTSNEFFNSPLIEILFAPYTFVGGMSAFAGWDWLSFVLESLIFVITIPFFYFLLVVSSHIRNRLKKSKL